MTLVDTHDELAAHQPWCARDVLDDGSPHACAWSVEIAGVRVALSQGEGAAELTVRSVEQTHLTAAQARRLAAELVDASRVLQSADRT
jgi:hypothetical protein